MNESWPAVWAWLRFFRSELRLVFGRRRNLLLLAVVAVFPVVIGVGLRLAIQPGNAGGPGVAFIGQLAGNGIFLGFIALTLLLTLVMPLAVAVIAGDSIAGEAGYGTLRYLLAVPAGRARTLAVKYAVIVVFALAITFVVTGMALATGAALFPIGPVELLSGTSVPLAGGIVRLLFVALYVAAAMASLGAIALAVSTLRRDPSVPADALVEFLRCFAPGTGRLRELAARPAVVRGVPAAVRLGGVGPVQHRGRNLLTGAAMSRTGGGTTVRSD